MASQQLPKDNPSIQKFHTARESGAKADVGLFASEAATIAWLEKSARNPQFVEQLIKFAEHHHTLAAASKLALRLFLGSVARALREGAIWYEQEAQSAGGGGGGSSSSSSGGGTAAKAAAAGAGGGGAKSAKTPGSGAPTSMSFDPRPLTPEPDPLETPPEVPGRAAEGMTH